MKSTVSCVSTVKCNLIGSSACECKYKSCYCIVPRKKTKVTKHLECDKSVTFPTEKSLRKQHHGLLLDESAESFRQRDGY